MKPPWPADVAECPSRSRGASVTSDMILSLRESTKQLASLNAGRLARFCSVENGLEPAPEHALPGKWHLALRLQALVGHDLLPGLVAGVLVRPFDEAEDDGLVVLGLHRSIEIGDLAVVDIIRDRFDDAVRTVLAEHLG